MNDKNTAELLLVLRIIDGAQHYKKLPKFLKDEIVMYLDSTSHDIPEAINNLKKKINE